MALTKKVFPYEALFRWDEKTGALKGYSLKTITVIMEDGAVLTVQESALMNVEQAKAAGFPLEAILDAARVSALANVDAANAERDEAVKQRDAAIKERDDVVNAAAAAGFVMGEPAPLVTPLINEATDVVKA